MRRLARPTGLSRGFTQPQQYPQSQKQQRRHVEARKPLSNYPRGVLTDQGSEPLKRSFPVFELPEIVLDLDAEGSPHVRPFDADTDGPLQEARWGHDPVLDEVKRDARLMKRPMWNALNKTRDATRDPFSGLRLSDFDIMAVLLTDQSSNLLPDNEAPAQRLDTKTRRASAIQYDLDCNGILRDIGRDATKIIPFMLHRRQLVLEAFKDPFKYNSSRDGHKGYLDSGIARCRNLAQLKRLCSRIDRPESGMEFSAASSDHVHARLLELLRSGKEGSNAADILKFVNNVTINRLSANKELNPSMTLFGLQLATNLGLLSCILQYLQICLTMGFITSRDETKTLTRSHVGNALLGALQRGECTARGTRQQIFTLLTGRGPDSLAPMPSLFGIAAKDHAQSPEVFELSARLFGEMGALRLLLYHWQQRAHQLRAVGQLREPEQQQGHEVQKVDQVYLEAFQRCTQVLSGLEAGIVSVDLTTMTGDVEEDAKRDLQNINAVEVFHARRASEGPESSMGKSSSIEDIKDALNKPDIRTSMVCFQKLIEEV